METPSSSAISALLNSRRNLYWLAWILLALSLAIPVSASHYGGRNSAISAVYVVGEAALFKRSFDAGGDGARLLPAAILVLAFFSNLIFLSTLGVRNAPRPAMSWRGLMLAALVVNASLGVAFPVFRFLPAYWLWLAAFGALARALWLPGTVSPAPPVRGGKARAALSGVGAEGGVPVLLWIWLGLTLFWLAVMVLNHAQTGEAQNAVPSANLSVALNNYFNDTKLLVSPNEGQRIADDLADFERETSVQLAVAIYPRVPENALEEFTIRVAEASRLGRKGLDNGAILFVFMQERKARLELGYGLEGVLPDALALEILEAELAPAFARGAYIEGIDATLAKLKDTVRTAFHTGYTVNPARTFLRQLQVGVPRFLTKLWPFLRQTDLDARIGISFFGSLLGLGIWSGLLNFGKLLRALGIAALNLARSRATATGIAKVEFSPMLDTLKILVFVAVLIASVVVVAGGGAYGGGGAMLQW